MSIHVALRHATRYRFDRPVALSPHVVRLKPAAHSRTPILAYSLKVTPEPHFLNWQQDPYGNFLARYVFPEKTREFSVEVGLVADLTVINPFDFFVEESADNWPFEYAPALKRQLAPYLEAEPAGPLLQALLDGIPREPVSTVTFLVQLNQQLQQRIGYNIRLEPGVQSCEQTLECARGSCRDSAWLLVQVLRHLGLAARFVSGYLVQLTADEKALDGPSGPEQDFTDLHAWTEVFVPGAGWIGLDPTSGLFAGEGHIPLACTPDTGSAAPIDGFTDMCEVEFEFANEVTRLHEDPRVTKPYSDDQWTLIQALGHRVDERLAARDVRLTQGGEPTFVSIDAMDAPEWNTEALGEHKRERAEVLARRLKQRFAPGALLHSAQGKWYPGEPLPRWALGLFWRKDGVPVWRDDRLLAAPHQNSGHQETHARRFAETLAHTLGVAPRHVQPAYEDALHYLLQEAELPANAAPLQADLSDPLERRSLAEKLSRGLDNPVGYVLPLEWDERQISPRPPLEKGGVSEAAGSSGFPLSQRGNEGDLATAAQAQASGIPPHPLLEKGGVEKGGVAGGWRSGPWRFRRSRLYLLPGDSPLGLRLPLASLIPDADTPSAPDPFAPRAPLADFHGEVARRYSHIGQRQDTHPEIIAQPLADAPHPPREAPRTALCVEARHGCLHVFLPPLNQLEHALALIAAVEHTAAALSMSVVLEGYPPPHDPRLIKLLVTPDPGVIEVNVHPARTWDELCQITLGLYEEARQSRLGAEKFMLDGRHSGTGGGNHFTLGGAAPADSPFLRRPDLLASFVTYWQHHPSLSYLFSGLFVGPTSQAPRVDEGRTEALYELEIACRQVPPGETPQPWLVDRLFRHLLTDLTGNTHRAEFCIDKLYSPDSATGRLGLVEFRGFEMPPHARMSLVQQLLLRALTARFWDKPYRHDLVRWGAGLHDRWMLPHFLWQDLQDVLRDLGEAGFPFQPEWFAPFLEFRFPRYGVLRVGELELELRAAIEPWPVLGEEAGNQGTARYVDSSLERLQIKLTGATADRYAVACNGRRVPLSATGVDGEFVAGLRYRAWQPPSALHPTIGVHTPLSIDLIDLWNQRAVAGCTYHVMHPGGRNFERYPVNANEAQARRNTRFSAEGHTPGSYTPPPWVNVLDRFIPDDNRLGPMAPPMEEGAGEYPYTLDLRRE